MSAALTAPFLAAGGVLCVSGAAKLRSPRTAVPALARLGLPARASLVRAIAAAELVLGATALAAPGRVVALWSQAPTRALPWWRCACTRSGPPAGALASPTRRPRESKRH